MISEAVFPFFIFIFYYLLSICFFLDLSQYFVKAETFKIRLRNRWQVPT
jgi:hypothetical protein